MNRLPWSWPRALVFAVAATFATVVEFGQSTAQIGPPKANQVVAGETVNATAVFPIKCDVDADAQTCHLVVDIATGGAGSVTLPFSASTTTTPFGQTGAAGSGIAIFGVSQTGTGGTWNPVVVTSGGALTVTGSLNATTTFPYAAATAAPTSASFVGMSGYNGANNVVVPVAVSTAGAIAVQPITAATSLPVVAATTLPVSIATTVPVSLATTVPVALSTGLPAGSATIGAVSQSGTWNIGSITTLPALATGANVIGSVGQSGTWNIGSIGTLPALPTGGNVIGSVGQSGSWNFACTTGCGNTFSAVTSSSPFGQTTSSTSAGVAMFGVSATGTGTNWNPLIVDSNGNAHVLVENSPLPTYTPSSSFGANVAAQPIIPEPANGTSFLSSITSANGSNTAAVDANGQINAAPEFTTTATITPAGVTVTNLGGYSFVSIALLSQVGTATFVTVAEGDGDGSYPWSPDACASSVNGATSTGSLGTTIPVSWRCTIGPHSAIKITEGGGTSISAQLSFGSGQLGTGTNATVSVGNTITNNNSGGQEKQLDSIPKSGPTFTQGGESGFGYYHSIGIPASVQSQYGPSAPEQCLSSQATAISGTSTNIVPFSSAATKTVWICGYQLSSSSAALNVTFYAIASGGLCSGSPTAVGYASLPSASAMAVVNASPGTVFTPPIPASGAGFCATTSTGTAEITVQYGIW